MAAGSGTRLRPFTEVIAKPFLPLMGVPVIQYTIDMLAAAGISDTVINIHHLSENSRKRISTLDWGGIHNVVSDESRCLLGSAGGLRKALPFFKEEPFFYVDADRIFELNFMRLAASHQKLKEDLNVLLTLGLYRTSGLSAAYSEILIDRKGSRCEGSRDSGQDMGLITGVGKKVSEKPFFMGVAVIEPEALIRLAEKKVCQFVPDILWPAIECGRAGFHFIDGRMLDADTPALWHRSHFELMDLLEEGSVPKLWKDRVERSSRKEASGRWVATIAGESPVNWQGKGYWAGTGEFSGQFGPRSVWYGSPPQTARLENGIGFEGKWVSLPSN